MLDKNKYKLSEVKELLDRNTAEYESKIHEQSTVINELSCENKRLHDELELLKGKEALINSAIKRAEITARKTEEKAALQYALAVDKLKVFLKRWSAYFEALKEKYPLYPAAIEAAELKAKLEVILGKAEPVRAIAAADKLLPQNNSDLTKIFDPKAKISEYVAATGDGGFNLDEVLNPGNLELEDLCKELGLLDGEE